jgi:hypothetical protein
MSTYELDDDLVRAWVGDPDPLAERILSSTEAGGKLAVMLQRQLPLPVPTKVGAVVRAYPDERGPREFLRYATNPMTADPWVEVGDHDMTPLRADDLGRIAEVLAEGVDL